MNLTASLYHRYSYKFSFYFFVFFLILQILFWQETHKIKPKYNLIPELPNKYSVKALSFGDEEFLFRIYGSNIQNAGDVFAGFVSLKLYDYNKLYNWFMLMDDLNHVSRLTPSLAAYIFANSKNHDDLRLIVKYLKNHGQRDLTNNWWWIFQAIYISSNLLQDNNEALELAKILSKNEDKNAPLWTKQMPAFIYAKRGEGCKAFFIINEIIQEINSEKREISASEIDFMRYFIETRLRKLKNNGFDPRKCKKL